MVAVTSPVGAGMAGWDGLGEQVPCRGTALDLLRTSPDARTLFEARLGPGR